MFAENLAERCAPRRFFRVDERLGFEHVPAQIKADWPNDQPEDERHAPSPRHQRLGRHIARDDRPDDRAEQQRSRLARHLETAIKTAPRERRRFDQQRRRAAELAAGRKALQQPREHDDQRRAQANGGIRWRNREQQDAERHQRDHHAQCRFAPGAIGIETQHDSADRAHDKRHAERGGSEEDGGIVAAGGEKQLGDHHRHEAEDHEVVPLERVADHGGDDRARVRCFADRACWSRRCHVTSARKGVRIAGLRLSVLRAGDARPRLGSNALRV